MSVLFIIFMQGEGLDYSILRSYAHCVCFNIMSLRGTFDAGWQEIYYLGLPVEI